MVTLSPRFITKPKTARRKALESGPRKAVVKETNLEAGANRRAPKVALVTSSIN